MDIQITHRSNNAPPGPPEIDSPVTYMSCLSVHQTCLQITHKNSTPSWTPSDRQMNNSYKSSGLGGGSGRIQEGVRGLGGELGVLEGLGFRDLKRS